MADKKKAVQLPQPSAAEVEFAQQLVERAKTDGVSLVGPGGLLPRGRPVSHCVVCVWCGIGGGRAGE